MLDTDTKRRIDAARDILVGKVPDPKSQVEQITIALIYKFMDDMDAEAEEMGGKRKFFANGFARYGWAKLMRSGLGGHEILNLYAEAIAKMPENPGIPLLFRDIFKNAYLPYRDPETLKMFLKVIDEFNYDHSEHLGDAYEYLLSILGSQGNAGQFRTPRHIIDFIVEVIDPKKNETVLDPACGSAGFLISSYKHILMNNSSKPSPQPSPTGRGGHSYRGGFDFSGLKTRAGELRQAQTDAETLLWELLRDRQLYNAKFRRQHQYGNYICDFFCKEAKLVVECDGTVHDTPDRQKVDKKRDAYLHSQGLTVLHFKNDRILNDTDAVLNEIFSNFPSISQPPSTTGRGDGGEGGVPGDLLTPDERGRLAKNFKGYDIDPLMVRLSLVNMYLHGFADPHIAEYDTLTSQDKWNEYADVILANPPFMSPKGGIKPHNRFSVQSKRSEVLFVDYMAEHLTPNGRAGIIVPEGIIFQSQTAYKQLRKMLVENYLVAVVSLPAGVFNPYSGVKTSILILDKTLAKRTRTIAFFKVENDGFGLGAQRREIDKNDLPQVQAELAAYLQAIRSGSSPFGRGRDEGNQPAHGLIVPKEKIAANGDYNLSGERYRESETRDSAFPHVRLDAIAEIAAGNSAPQGDEYFKDGEFLFIRTSDVGTVHLSDNILSAVDKVNQKTIDELRLRLFPAGTILFPKSGASTFLNHRVVMGKAAYVSSHLACIICDETKALPKYVYSLLCCVDAHQITPDQAYPSLRLTEIGKIEIPLPPLEVQKAIVAEIEGYQKVINGARAVIDNYQPHIPINPDWPMVELGAATEVTSGYSFNSKDFSPNNPVKCIKIANVGVQEFVNDEDSKLPSNFIAKYSEFVIREDDMVIALTRSIISTGLKVAIVPKSYNNSLLNQRVASIRSKGNLSNVKFVYFVLCSDFVFKYISEQARSLMQPNLSITDLKILKIPLPPLAIQQTIVAEIEAEQALVKANHELIIRFKKKIQSTLARVWEEDGPTPIDES